MFFWDALCAQCGFWGAELWRVVPLEMVRSGNQRGDADFVQWGISQIVIFNGYFPNWDFLNRDFSEIFWTEIFEHPIFPMCTLRNAKHTISIPLSTTTNRLCTVFRSKIFIQRFAASYYEGRTQEDMYFSPPAMFGKFDAIWCKLNYKWPHQWID
jgi:hypothetical protein